MRKVAIAVTLGIAMAVSVSQPSFTPLVIMSLQAEIPDVSVLSQLDEKAIEKALVQRGYEVHTRDGVRFAIPRPDVTMPQVMLSSTILEAIQNKRISLDRLYTLENLPSEVVSAFEKAWGSESLNKIAPDLPIEFTVQLRCRLRDASGQEHQATLAVIRAGSIRPILQYREPESPSKRDSRYPDWRNDQTPSVRLAASERSQPPQEDDVVSMRFYFVRVPEGRREEFAKTALDLSLQQRARAVEHLRKLAQDILKNQLAGHKTPLGRVAPNRLPPILQESLGDFLASRGIALDGVSEVEIHADLVARIPRRLGSSYYILGVPLATTGRPYTVIPR